MSPLNITQPLDSIRYMVYNGYYKVMSNMPKMGHLTTPDKDRVFLEWLYHIVAATTNIYSMNIPIKLPSGQRDHITIENHHAMYCSWVNPLFRLGHFPVRKL